MPTIRVTRQGIEVLAPVNATPDPIPIVLRVTRQGIEVLAEVDFVEPEPETPAATYPTSISSGFSRVMTLEDVARNAKAQLDSSIPLPLVVQWASQRYLEFCGRSRLPHLRKKLELSLPAIIDDGTATFTQNSYVVVGDATAAAAWPGNLDSHWNIRASGSSQWYTVRGVNGTSLYLQSPFVTATLTASGYYLAKRFHALPTGARWLGPLVHDPTTSTLTRRSMEDLDELHPSRINIADVPIYYADAGADPTGARLIEVYPQPLTAQLLRASWWPDPPQLGPQDPLPPRVDPGVLEAGTRVTIATREASLALRAGQAEIGAIWLKERNVQIQLWERSLVTGTLAETKDEVSHFVLSGYGESTDYPPQVRTARDEYWYIP